MSKKTLVFAILLSIICLLLVGCSDREMTDITISVETNGGTSVPTYATVILEAPKTTKQGFYFDNWYKDAALTERIMLQVLVVRYMQNGLTLKMADRQKSNIQFHKTEQGIMRVSTKRMVKVL